MHSIQLVDTIEETYCILNDVNNIPYVHQCTRSQNMECFRKVVSAHCEGKVPTNATDCISLMQATVMPEYTVRGRAVGHKRA